MSIPTAAKVAEARALLHDAEDRCKTLRTQLERAEALAARRKAIYQGLHAAHMHARVQRAEERAQEKAKVEAREQSQEATA
jgi:hypothetical protein